MAWRRTPVESVVSEMSSRRSYWNGKSVFVTGATGFVGGWLAKELVALGARVVCLVRDVIPRSIFFGSGLKDRVVSVAGSLQDLPLLERVLQEYEIDTCFHLAAEAIVSVASGSPLSAFESNIRGTWHLLDATRRSGVVRRVVVASSDKVYGSQAVLPYREDAAMQGCYPYDVSKSCADLLARAYFQSYNLAVAITRCANIYGGGDFNFSRLIPGTIRSVLRGERPLIRSDGQYTRDFLYIDDAVEAYLMLAEALDREEVRGRAFNFGTGSPVQVLDLVKTIISMGGREDLVPVILNHASNEIKDQYLCSENARKVLGWEPRATLGVGLEKTFRWYEKFLLDESIPQRREL